MTPTELKNTIIRKILSIEDEQLLEYINNIISKDVEKSFYELNDFEKKIIMESMINYENGNNSTNQDIENKVNKWLKE